MKPLARVTPRLFFEPIVASAASRSLRLSNQPSFRASTCLQCRIRSQIRRYVDDSKPSPPTASSTPPNPSPISPLPENVAKDLPSAAADRRSAMGKRFSNVMDQLQGNIFIASQRLNDLTGYSGIEALKVRIAALEAGVQAAQETVRSERQTYKSTVAERAATQKEVTTLLARKDSWMPSDLERFTSLYRMDHTNEQAVQEAGTRLADAEREAEHAANELSRSILSRYHEEQIWSDKIRRMSTWGTWGLMGVNVLLFLVFQLGFEPWRGRRLVRGFEEKVREALEKEKLSQATGRAGTADEISLDGIVEAGVEDLEAGAGNPQVSDPVVDAVVASIRKDPGQLEDGVALHTTKIHVPGALVFGVPETWKAALQDLFSDRVISKRKQDITLIALEGAATGAAIATILVTLILRHS
jgi:sensitive to high expression protein 9